MSSSRNTILLTGADNGRYLSLLARAFQSQGFKVVRLFVRLPTTGGTPVGTNSKHFEKVISFVLRMVYGSPVARRAGSWALTALAACALRLLPARFFLTIINSPQLGHRSVFLAAQAGNVKVISVFHGSDIRPPYLNGLLSLNLSSSEIYSRTRTLKETAELVEVFSFRVIAWSKTGHFLERPYLCHELIGFPLNPLVDSYPLLDSEAADPPIGRSAFRILHAPSSQGKGTDEIVTAVESLRLQGINVSLSVVRNLATIDLFKEIHEHDLVIDQIYADSAPSVLAMECLMLHTPVLMAGWSIADTSARFKPVTELSIFDPEDLERVLARLITDSSAYEVLREKQSSLADYLTREWSSENIATKILQSLSEAFPSKASGVPCPPGFSTGGFGPPGQIRSALRSYISEFGPEALFLGKNLRLQNMITGWAEDQVFHPRDTAS